MSPAARAAVLSRYASDGMATHTPQRLVVLLFERLIADLNKAKMGIEAGSIEIAHDNLVHGQEIVFELRMALDIESFDGAHELAAIYDHLITEMVEANRLKSAITVEHCISVATPLAETFSEIHRTLTAQNGVS